MREPLRYTERSWFLMSSIVRRSVALVVLLLACSVVYPAFANELRHEIVIALNPQSPNPGDVWCGPDGWTTYYYNTDGAITNNVHFECVDGQADFRRMQWEVKVTGDNQIRLRLRARDRGHGLTRV